MLAVTVTPGGSPALRELPSPTAPPGGILVRVRACGLCGSDVEKLRPGGAIAGTMRGHEPLCPAFIASALEPGGFCELTAASPAHVAHAVLRLPESVSDLAGSF